MKLHLPKALVAALTAVYATAVPLATTAGVGVLVFSSVSVPKALGDYTWIEGSGTFTDNGSWNAQANWQETIPTGIIVGVGSASAAWEKMIFDASIPQKDGNRLSTLEVSNGTVNLKNDQTATKLRISDAGSNVTIQADSSLHVTGETLSVAGDQASFMLGEEGGTVNLDVYGTLTSDAGFSVRDGHGHINEWNQFGRGGHQDPFG